MMGELGQMNVELRPEEVFNGQCHLAMLPVADRREKVLIESLVEKFL